MRKDFSSEGFDLYRVEDGNVPENTYIICSKASRNILYNPHIAGQELQGSMEEMSSVFIKALTEKALKGTRLGDVVEFVLLAGGLYYFLAPAFRKVHGHALPQCFLGIKRQRVEGTEGEFRAVSTYENFESLPKEAVVLIGDTIATGATLVRAISDLEAAVDEKGGRLGKLVVCSLACSTEGARRLRKLEERLRERNKDFQLYLIVAEQLFHLMPDGTDLRFLGVDTMMPPETREHTMERYGDFLGKEMKCAVFDWGTRCKNPKKHYEEFLGFCGDILKDEEIDEKGKAEISRMKAETEKEISDLEKVF